MSKWKFLSRSYGETEGYSNGSLAEFKGNPLKALSREICQNSLDAADKSGKPVVVEFEKTFMKISEFPGMDSMKEVIKACDDFWEGKNDINTRTFLSNTKKNLRNEKFFVLRVSDYNTTGVRGAFWDDDITPWGGLVKGNAFSVKSDEKNSAGSYGIGKAAPFVSSYYQTVFYRTVDIDGVKAAMGVARLMAHESITEVPKGEDPVRRSVGYYGADSSGKPAISIPELDEINVRTECGTDLFIPGFTGGTADDEWVKEILKEVIDNFLFSIYSGKLEVRIGRKVLNRENLSYLIDYVGSKDAKIFYEVIRKDNLDVKEEVRDFHQLGTLQLRLLYAPDLNKKVLVVRNSGMRIAKISSLPRQISYTSFLELQGPELNSFFRAMENPSHNAWEPKRHEDPEKAKKYKEEVEKWVIEKIAEKLSEVIGSESDIDIGDCFNFKNNDNATTNRRMEEQVSDDTQEVKYETYIPQLPASGKISIYDEGNTGRNRKVSATEAPDGESVGHRRRTGTRPGGMPTGRKVTDDPDGKDTRNVGDGGNPREVLVTARIVSQGNGVNKLIITPDEYIKRGHVEIVARGENGKSLKLYVINVMSEFAKAEDGHIVIESIQAKEKITIIFELVDNQNYAMGVKAYAN